MRWNSQRSIVKKSFTHRRQLLSNWKTLSCLWVARAALLNSWRVARILSIIRPAETHSNMVLMIWSLNTASDWHKMRQITFTTDWCRHVAFVMGSNRQAHTIVVSANDVSWEWITTVPGSITVWGRGIKKHFYFSSSMCSVFVCFIWQISCGQLFFVHLDSESVVGILICTIPESLQ